MKKQMIVAALCVALAAPAHAGARVGTPPSSGNDDGIIAVAVIVAIATWIFSGQGTRTRNGVKTKKSATSEY